MEEKRKKVTMEKIKKGLDSQEKSKNKTIKTVIMWKSKRKVGKCKVMRLREKREVAGERRMKKVDYQEKSKNGVKK